MRHAQLNDITASPYMRQVDLPSRCVGTIRPLRIDYPLKRLCDRHTTI